MLRIESIEKSTGDCVLRLEGQVIGPWVAEIRRSCDQALAAGVELKLDLTDVTFIDRSGIELFRGLMQAGVTVMNCSPFLRSQLRTS